MATICAPVLLVLACGVLLNTCSKSTDLVWAKRFKTEYYYKQDLDVSGGRLAKPSGDKIALVDATPKMVSGLSSDTIGKSTLKIT